MPGKRSEFASLTERLLTAARRRGVGSAESLHSQLAGIAAALLCDRPELARERAELLATWLLGEGWQP